MHHRSPHFTNRSAVQVGNQNENRFRYNLYILYTVSLLYIAVDIRPKGVTSDMNAKEKNIMDEAILSDE